MLTVSPPTQLPSMQRPPPAEPTRGIRPVMAISCSKVAFLRSAYPTSGRWTVTGTTPGGESVALHKRRMVVAIRTTCTLSHGVAPSITVGTPAPSSPSRLIRMSTMLFAPLSVRVGVQTQRACESYKTKERGRGRSPRFEALLAGYPARGETACRMGAGV